jgi:hypothetical protein
MPAALTMARAARSTRGCHICNQTMIALAEAQMARLDGTAITAPVALSASLNQRTSAQPGTTDVNARARSRRTGPSPPSATSAARAAVTTRQPMSTPISSRASTGCAAWRTAAGVTVRLGTAGAGRAPGLGATASRRPGAGSRRLGGAADGLVDSTAGSLDFRRLLGFGLAAVSPAGFALRLAFGLAAASPAGRCGRLPEDFDLARRGRPSSPPCDSLIPPSCCASIQVGDAAVTASVRRCLHQDVTGPVVLGRGPTAQVTQPSAFETDVASTISIRSSGTWKEGWNEAKLTEAERQRFGAWNARHEVGAPSHRPAYVRICAVP